MFPNIPYNEGDFLSKDSYKLRIMLSMCVEIKSKEHLAKCKHSQDPAILGLLNKVSLGGGGGEESTHPRGAGGSTPPHSR